MYGHYILNYHFALAIMSQNEAFNETPNYRDGPLLKGR